MKHIISNEALEDLVDVWLYGADTWGVPQADRYNDRFRDAFSRLEEFPELGAARSVIGPSVRVLPVGSHLVVYRVSECIEIIRVLHHRQDTHAILRG